MKLYAWVGVLVVSGAAACGDDDGKPAACDGAACVVADAGERDAAVVDPMDASRSDAARPDATLSDAAPGRDGSTAPDGASAPDAGDVCNASVAPALPTLGLTTLVEGRDRLVFAAQPKGSSDWYLVHQKGRIEILRGSMVLAAPFLDLSAQVNQGLDANDERGLLGLAFAPDYATSGKLYVALTPNRDGDANLNRDLVLEYTRSAGNADAADVSTRKEILRLEPSAGNHNGGNLLFGPDGMLYVGSGDGGGSCNSDKPDTPQELDSLFGKILRLDPKGAAPDYAASGNPYSGATGDARVLHYGIRNPFRFGFDSLTGDLYFGDVGQDSYEEISLAPAGSKGLNFGWAAFEGDAMGTCGGRTLRAGSSHTKPILSVDRRKVGAAPGPFTDYVSIMGGRVYRGSAIPGLRGVYVFGDYTGKRMGALRQCGAQTSPVTVLRKTRDANAPNEAYLRLPTGSSFNELTGIMEDEAGELYMVVNRNSLRKLVPGT